MNLHEEGVALGGRFSSMDLRLAEGGHWLALPPAMDTSLLWPQAHRELGEIAAVNKLESTPAAAGVKWVDRPIDWGVTLTEQWASGRISNFEVEAREKKEV